MGVRLALSLAFIAAMGSTSKSAQAPMAFGYLGLPTMQIEALSADRTRVEMTSPDGTKVFVEAHDVTVLPHANLGGGAYVYFGQGQIVSSLNPDLTKEFPCLSIGLPNTRDKLVASIRATVQDMNPNRRGMWDYGVQKACTHRERFGLARP